jgi:UDP-N-acetylmuramoyl-tripeptide--D-alanyl-D-alanine ligase
MTILKIIKTIIVNENDPIQVEKTENYSPKITFGKESSDYKFELFSQRTFCRFNIQRKKQFQNLRENIISPIFVLQQV